MNNSFNSVVKALVYTFIVLAYLLYLSPKLLGVLMAGIFTLVFSLNATIVYCTKSSEVYNIVQYSI